MCKPNIFRPLHKLYMDPQIPLSNKHIAIFQLDLSLHSKFVAQNLENFATLEVKPIHFLHGIVLRKMAIISGYYPRGKGPFAE